MSINNNTVFIEIAEFFGNPIRTGIQRTLRQLMANWPKDVAYQYVRYDYLTGQLVHISDKAIDFLFGQSQQDDLPPEEIARRAMSFEAGKEKFVKTDHKTSILIPELFFHGGRVQFYENSIDNETLNPHFIIYDYIPWTRPDLMNAGGDRGIGIMPYLILTIKANKRCFISNTTRKDFRRISRIADADVGPAISLGANGLGLDKQIFDPRKKNFVCLGTLEWRKRQDIPFDAYRSLCVSGQDGVLQIIGRVPNAVPPGFKNMIEYCGPDIKIIDRPTDEELCEHLSHARGVVFTSEGEGFGLPALESLAAGIPVIAHSRLPALDGIDPCGQIRLNTISVESVAKAFKQLRDDSEAERLWTEAAGLELPTWKDYARRVADWVREG